MKTNKNDEERERYEMSFLFMCKFWFMIVVLGRGIRNDFNVFVSFVAVFIFLQKKRETNKMVIILKIEHVDSVFLVI